MKTKKLKLTDDQLAEILAARINENVDAYANDYIEAKTFVDRQTVLDNFLVYQSQYSLPGLRKAARDRFNWIVQHAQR